MVSTVMGAPMIGPIYFLRANCAQHGGKASGGGLISASLLSYRAPVPARESASCMYSGDGTPAACAARRGDKMFLVAQLPTFPGDGPIRHPDALDNHSRRKWETFPAATCLCGLSTSRVIGSICSGRTLPP